jgi:type I restriction enzyme S subunit
MVIPIPSFDEQRRIVDKIEQQFAIVEKAKQAAVEQLAAAHELNSAYLREMFDGYNWEYVALKNIIQLESGKFLPAKEQYKNGVHKVYGGNGVTGTHDKYFINNPSVIIGRVGEKCGAVHVTEPKSWVTDNALIVEIKNKINIQYLSLTLHALQLRTLAKSTGQPSLSQTVILEQRIPLPTLEEQHHIAKTFENNVAKSNKVFAAIQSQLDTINALPAAILRQAFNRQI